MIKKEIEAEITVFISLILIMVLSLIFTLLESARSEGLRLRIQAAANASIESAFAQYDKILWDDYGLLFFADRYGSANELRQETKEYAEKNSGNPVLGHDWLSFDVKDIDVNNYVLATDDNGKVFQNAVIAYMKQAGVMESVSDAFSEKDFSSAFKEDIFNDDGEIDFSKIAGKINKTKEEKGAYEEENNNAETPKKNEDKNAERAKETYNSLLSLFDSYKKKGFLSLVCEDVGSISDDAYNLTNAPSKISNAEKSRRDATLPQPDAAELILFKEFLMQRFDLYTGDNYERLELEYLLCGEDSDLSNLYSTVNKLVAIRTGLNLAFMFTNSRCDAEAEALAAALVGWLLVPGLTTAVKAIILIIWSIAEAVADVKALLAGGKIPLIKKDGDLQVSLDSLLKSSKGGCSSGLTYEGYIRGLLYIHDASELSYRAMDVIQLHVQNKEPAFLMKNCVYAANISLCAEADGIFPYLPKPLNYKHSFAAAYSYGEVEKFY